MMAARRLWAGLFAEALLLLMPAMAKDVGAPLLTAAPGVGQSELSLRYRFEFVEQSNAGDDARASTLRARLNYQTGQFRNFSAMVEFDSVQTIGSEHYNSGAGTSGANRQIFPVIADPEYTEINQAFIQFTAANNSQLRIGRQRLNFDNQRFVGGVGWRQNEQTYDGVAFSSEAIVGTTVQYAYVGNVNRIFGGDVPAGDHSSATHLLNLKHQLGEAASVSGYYYHLDNKDVPALSSATVGLRLTGKTTLSGYPWRYTVDVAHQNDSADNPHPYSANYLRVDSQLTFAQINLLLGYEMLGSAGRSRPAFSTPLATLHAFNGWADQFLSTPPSGLKDLFVGARGALGGFNWQAVWHSFHTERSTFDNADRYGHEFDLSASTILAEKYTLLLKLAHFDADAPGFQDTTKAWLMLSVDF